ncbi:MAG: hypothetical protein P0Y49_07675 [Candidatus Pedobacter colombiensis]|uniref:DUF2306 domain-containing protein n=1 Tax=Candidatus Pedobacter colombiensis TaxID=3121371 RepID=A0AAJ6B7E4_9SPHI|nr:hypothetical protein [Pedobacter sp.]WEK21017.1 MAG: hypothetical protein P0Y49_07675 [Pedobacter sp.]
MDILFKMFLMLHIVAGTIGLMSGTINIIGKKGGKRHRVIGLIFLYSMLIVSVSAFVLSILHSDYFLFIVGVFTLYMTSSGTRYLHLKNLSKGQKPATIDWVLTYFMLSFGVLFLLFGLYHLVNKNSFGIVCIVFGIIGLRMVRTDFRNFSGNTEIANAWLVAHIQRMVGAYIATLTAFLVVNNKVIPAYIAWLLPTVIMFPLIVMWVKKYKVIKRPVVSRIRAEL